MQSEIVPFLVHSVWYNAFVNSDCPGSHTRPIHFLGVLAMNHKNYIRTMFEATRDGMLTLTHYPEDGSEEFDRTYPVNWDSQTAEALEKQFDKLRGHLDHIGLLHD